MRVNIRPIISSTPTKYKSTGPQSKKQLHSNRTNEKKSPFQDNKKRTALSDIFSELNILVGMEKIKQLIHEIYAYVEIQRKRQIEELNNENTVLHMIFKGNPGTGKTTVARILGNLFREMNILEKGHVIEIERADLVGEYIGHTAQRTREHIKKSLGGVLFIDEAYSLARGGEKDFGKEAIDCLCKGMEDHRDNLVLILAGYNDEMEWFLQANPGLRSRFPIQLHFPDYSTKELLDIADMMLKQRQYTLSTSAKEELRHIIESSSKSKHNGNARLVRNIIERSMRSQAVRLIKLKKLNREDLMTISREDMIKARNDL